MLHQHLEPLPGVPAQGAVPRDKQIGIGLFVGPAQSAARTYLVRLTPPGLEGQNFGFYAMTGRAASFLSPALFGLCAFLGGDDRWGILGIMLVLGAGLLALLAVPSDVRDRATSG